eukprot:TRINITY_DN2159_c0_g1_i1.p1 TRINITY_DN2159_c0_g1~~TRINITY_DN2159_c0_g1_i1.p1  ORF type:complete len:787 (+),score=208.88 TRINITY_DN2159_c0_g1_i1:255-2363(+)
MMKNQMYQKGGYEKGTTSNDTNLSGLITPCSDYIGAKLLRKMGWRPGFGVGSKKSRKKKKNKNKDTDSSDSDDAINLPPEPKIDIFFQKQKGRTEYSGPGYTPPVTAAPSTTRSQTSGRTYMGSSLQADVDSDDEMHYATEDMSLYDEAFVNPSGYAKKVTSATDVSRQHTQTLLRGYDPRDINASDEMFERWPIAFITSPNEVAVHDSGVVVPDGWMPDPQRATTSSITAPVSVPIQRKVIKQPSSRQLPNALSMRFTSGQKQDLQNKPDTGFTGGLVTTDQLRQLTECKSSPSTTQPAVTEPKAQKLQKRKTRTWFPAQLLCKRFGVNDPHPDVIEKGDYESTQKNTGPTTLLAATSAEAFAEALEQDKRRKAADKSAAKKQRRAQRAFDEFQNQIAESRKAVVDSADNDVKKEQEHELKSRLLALRLQKEKEVNTNNNEYVTNTVADIMSGFVEPTSEQTPSAETPIAAAIFDDGNIKEEATDNVNDPSIKVEQPTSKGSAAAAVFDSDSEDEVKVKTEPKPTPKRVGVLDRIEQQPPNESSQPPSSALGGVLSQRPAMSIFSSIFETDKSSSSDSESSEDNASDDEDNKKAKNELIFATKSTPASALEKENLAIRSRIARLREICESSTDESSSSSSDTESRRRKKKSAKKAKKEGKEEDQKGEKTRKKSQEKGEAKGQKGAPKGKKKAQARRRSHRQ